MKILTLQRILNVLFIYVLCGVLISAYVYQYTTQEEPCPLCLLQRLGMLGVAFGLLMNLRFGIKMEHYGFSMLSAILGESISLRQIALHVCPEFPTFGEPVLGLDLYAWAFVVFTCSFFAIAVLLIIFGFTNHKPAKPVLGIPEKIAFGFTLFLALANTITTLMECGLSACKG